MQDEPLFRLDGVSKTFGATVALRDVHLSVREGEIHALLGHNGSGKSTLIKILAGFHQPDRPTTGRIGTVRFDLGSYAAAHEAGLRFVHQDLGLVDSMDAVDNLALGASYIRRAGFIDRRACRRRAERVLASIGYDIPVGAPVGRLTAGQRTGVAIARALQDLGERTRLLVLDEPTAAMSAAEATRLFEVVGLIASRGVGVLFVTHHLNEVFDVAETATVLRDGRHVATRPVRDLSADELVELIVGAEFARGGAGQEGDRPIGRTALRVGDLVTEGVHDATLDVRAGEIVGVAGIEGSGRIELLEAIAGCRARRGTVTIGDRQVPPYKPHAARRAGLGFAPADRTRNSIFADLAVTANITAPGVRDYVRFGLLSRRGEHAEALDWVNRLDIRPTNPAALMGSLSGGNQQKAVVARWLARRPKVLLLLEPTSGVDIAARESIYGAIRIAADSGGVLIGSSDSEELAAVCDRVLVMRRGVIVSELAGAGLTATAIDRLSILVEPTPEAVTAHG